MDNKVQYARGGSSWAHAIFNHNATNIEYMKHEVSMLKDLLVKNKMILQIDNQSDNYSIKVNGAYYFSYDLHFVEECRIVDPFLFRNILLDKIQKAEVRR